TCVELCQEIADNSEKWGGVRAWSTVGIHPCHAKEVDEEGFWDTFKARVDAGLKSGYVKAFGEFGLDCKFLDSAMRGRAFCGTEGTNTGVSQTTDWNGPTPKRNAAPSPLNSSTSDLSPLPSLSSSIPVLLIPTFFLFSSPIFPTFPVPLSIPSPVPSTNSMSCSIS